MSLATIALPRTLKVFRYSPSVPGCGTTIVVSLGTFQCIRELGVERIKVKEEVGSAYVVFVPAIIEVADLRCISLNTIRPVNAILLVGIIVVVRVVSLSVGKLPSGVLIAKLARVDR